MRVIVLGCSPVQPNPGEACSGYLLQIGKRHFLVDAGPGVIAAWLEHQPYQSIESVFLTHAHPDHCLDLVTLRQCLAHGLGPKRSDPLPVYASPTTIETLHAIGRAFGHESDADVDYWSEFMEFREIVAESRLDLDGLSVRFAETRHYLPTLAMRFEAQGRSVVFGADSGPSEDLTALSFGADLLLSEATLPRRSDPEKEWGHMTAAEAGEMAAAAGVAALRLVHYFVEHDARRVAAEAAARFEGDTRAARPGDVYVL